MSEPPFAAAAVVAAPLSEEPPHAVRLAAIAAARIVNITFGLSHNLPSFLLIDPDHLQDLELSNKMSDVILFYYIRHLMSMDCEKFVYLKCVFYVFTILYLYFWQHYFVFVFIAGNAFVQMYKRH